MLRIVERHQPTTSSHASPLNRKLLINRSADIPTRKLSTPLHDLEKRCYHFWSSDARNPLRRRTQRSFLPEQLLDRLHRPLLTFTHHPWQCG